MNHFFLLKLVWEICSWLKRKGSGISKRAAEELPPGSEPHCKGDCFEHWYCTCFFLLFWVWVFQNTEGTHFRVLGYLMDCTILFNTVASAPSSCVQANILQVFQPHITRITIVYLQNPNKTTSNQIFKPSDKPIQCTLTITHHCHLLQNHQARPELDEDAFQTLDLKTIEVHDADHRIWSNLDVKLLKVMDNGPKQMG